MPTATAYKPVRDDYTSTFRGGMRSEDVDLCVADDAFELLRLTYTVGTTVTPDPATELAVKGSSRDAGVRRRAADTAGLYAFRGPDALREATGIAAGVAEFETTFSGAPKAVDTVTQVAPYGHVVLLTYDLDDLLGTISSHSVFPDYSVVRLRSCVVTSRVATAFDP